MEDSIEVRVPGRKWAMTAIDDLAREGCRAELTGRDSDGLWILRVSGPSDLIDVMRYELQVPALRVCWEAFVNEAVAG